AVVLGGGDDLEGALEVVVGLTGEADDDVGGDGKIGYERARLAQTGEVALGAVAPMHGREHSIAAGLEWQVEVLADRRHVSHGVDRLGSQVLRVRARVAHATDAVDAADGS